MSLSLTDEEQQFLEIALNQGLLSEDQKEEALENLKLLREINLDLPLWNVLEKKNFLSKKDVQKIRSLQGRDEYFLKGEDIPKVIGSYELIEKLGQGAMGIVYKAKQARLERIVALKILFPHLAYEEEYIHLFLREARSAARLNHPNIVAAYDSGEDNGFYYFAMEYVEGISLDRYILKYGPMDEREGAYVIREIGKALDHASQQGIVHRDIKPGNIFLTEDGVPKLGDLGLAKPKGDLRLTKTNIFFGSPYYISPEQMENYSEVDVRADIYSLGISFFELLTGRVPFEDAHYAEILHKHFTQDIPSIRTLRPETSDEINFIILKMTRKNREERYSSPKELVSDLDAYLHGAKINLQEGRFYFDSKIEKGLPASQLSRESLSNSTKDTQKIFTSLVEKEKKPSILVVEDDEDMIQFLKAILGSQGYQLTFAQDGVDALMTLALHDFDLILSDVVMPNLDGLKLLELKSKKGIN
ncbi:MAG: response regulator, partial [Planctomycetota bacterium]